MKKLIVLALFAFGFTTSQAQIDVSINPLGLLFSNPDLSAEYIVNENIGVELTLGAVYGKTAALGLGEEFRLSKSGYKVRLSGKYYFKPNNGGDRFYAGVYLGPRSTKQTGDSAVWGEDYGYKVSAFTAGVNLGFKWVGDNGIVFEIGGGAGRAFGNKIEFIDPDGSNPVVEGFGIDGFGKLSVGYRLGN